MRHKKTNKHWAKFVKYMRRTHKNKLASLAMLGLGVLSTAVTGDGTVLLLFVIVGVPLFFARTNWMTY